jgi:hypothetical protein
MLTFGHALGIFPIDAYNYNMGYLYFRRSPSQSQGH